MTTAALGGKVLVETLDGEESLDIHGGMQSNETIRLRGHGVPRRSGRGRGDLVVRVHVTTPSKLSRKEKDLLKELSALHKSDAKQSRSALRRALDRRD